MKNLFTLFLFLVGISSSVSGQQNVVRICGIRVDFQPDANELTTGDGTFLLDGTNVNEFTIDPPPHNRSYFQDQIIAVRNYFLAATKGKILIEGDIFPAAQDGAYRLPMPMGDYNPNRSEEENNRQLAQLFADALQLADADIDFSRYDLVVVFHAGVGKDIDFGFDETPQDIPSLYLTPGFFSDYFDPAFNGFEVDNGLVSIDRGIILPETESQEGLEIALTGIFASNVGSHFGLFDLFSAKDQQTGIGRFGLMDAGLLNLFGLTPALPSAFSRELAGWDTPQVLNGPTTLVQVDRLGSGTGQTLYKIPINSSEYYLIEYRGERKINIDSVYFELSDGRETAPTYLELLKTYLPDRITVSDSTGVLLKIDDYDWGLPGAGILIWHIDRQVITAQAANNHINDDRNNRAVDLEEADGSQDIGYSYQITEPGFQSELGTWLDFWFKGNPAPLYQNEFSSNSSPNTLSNRTFAESHIRLYDFSANSGSQMTFRYDRDYFETGFPVSLLPDSVEQRFGSLVQTNLANGEKAVFVAADNGAVFGIRAAGRGVLRDDLFQIASFPVATLPGLVIMDSTADGSGELLIAADTSGKVSAFTFSDDNLDFEVDRIFSVDLGRKFTSPPVCFGSKIFIGGENGKVYRLDSFGNLEATLNTQSSESVNDVVVLSVSTVIGNRPDGWSVMVADLNSDNLADTLFIAENSLNIAGETVRLPDSMKGNPSIGDVDNDGFYEIVLVTASQVYAYNYNGVLLANYPVKPVIQTDEQLIGTPLLFDADGNGTSDIVFTTNRGQIFAYDLNGDILSGFPFSTSAEMLDGPVVLNLDSDENLEMLAVNSAGDLHAWQLGGEAAQSTLWWAQTRFNSTNNNNIERVLQAAPAASSDLLPKNRAFNYPNPNQGNRTFIRYYLKEPAEVSIKIFDLAGSLVDSFNGPGQGRIENEIAWNVSEVESGVYLCRIEAKSSRSSGVQIFKIMVVH